MFAVLERYSEMHSQDSRVDPYHTHCRGRVRRGPLHPSWSPREIPLFLWRSAGGHWTPHIQSTDLILVVGLLSSWDESNHCGAIHILYDGVWEMDWGAVGCVVCEWEGTQSTVLIVMVLDRYRDRVWQPVVSLSRNLSWRGKFREKLKDNMLSRVCNESVGQRLLLIFFHSYIHRHDFRWQCLCCCFVKLF